MSRCRRPWPCRKRIPSTTSRAIWSLSLSDKPAWLKNKYIQKQWDGRLGLSDTCLFLITESSSHLQACVEVSVQPLHDEQHGDAGAASVGVINHRAVQVDETLVLRQSPEGKMVQLYFYLIGFVFYIIRQVFRNILFFTMAVSHIIIKQPLFYVEVTEYCRMFVHVTQPQSCIPQVYGSLSRRALIKQAGTLTQHRLKASTVKTSFCTVAGVWPL